MYNPFPILFLTLQFQNACFSDPISDKPLTALCVNLNSAI